jgi:phosphomannomutase
VPSSSPIRFGTDGWRAVISDEFTFDNVRRVARAIGDYVLEEFEKGEVSSDEPPAVVIGYDTRFLSDRYALAVAEILGRQGLRAVLSRSTCPTPALSYAVRALGAAAGVMITASHNPPRYNGLKVKAPHGGPASSDVIHRIEAYLKRRVGTDPTEISSPLPPRPVERLNLLPIYLEHIRGLVNLEAIGRSDLHVVVDPMYGSGRGYLRSILTAAGCDVMEIRGELNPGFGGIYPEPIERNLAALVAAVRDNHCDVGLATDGDADRIGAVDSEGRFVNPHIIFALVLRHLVEERGMRGAVIKTISTTQMVNRLAERYGLPVHETPVGFNYIADLILENDVLIGGEESGGITIKGHIPEGDGILMGLLLLEIMARRDDRYDDTPDARRTRHWLRDIIDELMADVGPFFYARSDVPSAQPFVKAELVARLKASAPARLCGVPVAQVLDTDGIKYVLEDDSWLLIRPSGTEPVLRIYAEAGSPEAVQGLLREGARLAGV